METSEKLAFLCTVLSALSFICIQPSFVNAGAVWEATSWTSSHATFYGGTDAAGTMGGACGYGNMYSRGYGIETAALSTTLFNNGLTCGACFQIKCKVSESRWCYPNAGSIQITATNFCPANWNRPTNNGGWCNPPRTHFDLSYPMFQKLAKPVGGIIPIQFRRVPCVKVGGIRFVMNGNPWFNLVLIYNVAGGGNVVSVKMKGDKTGWFPMRHNWGQNWELSQKLVGQSISFRVSLGSGKVLLAYNVAPPDWKFQQTFESAKNF